MASGDYLFTLKPHGSTPTTTVNASLDTITDGSTVVGITPVLDYAGATADESADWHLIVPSQYSGGGLTFEINWAPAGTVSNDVQFEIRAIQDVASDTLTSQDLGAQTATTIADTPGGTADVVHVTSTGTMTHANAGSPAAGDKFRIRISRNYDHTANSDDAQFICCYVTET